MIQNRYSTIYGTNTHWILSGSICYNNRCKDAIEEELPRWKNHIATDSRAALKALGSDTYKSIQAAINKLVWVLPHANTDEILFPTFLRKSQNTHYVGPWQILSTNVKQKIKAALHKQHDIYWTEVKGHSENKLSVLIKMNTFYVIVQKNERSFIWGISRPFIHI